jgi:hypothetical protein
MRQISKKQQERNKSKKDETLEMFNLFLEIWDERQDEEGNCYCFESGKKLNRSYFRELSTCYHHVLAKSKSSYPEYKLLKKNIVILHPEIHNQVENSLDRCPKIKKLKEELLELHMEGKL